MSATPKQWTSKFPPGLRIRVTRGGACRWSCTHSPAVLRRLHRDGADRILVARLLAGQRRALARAAALRAGRTPYGVSISRSLDSGEPAQYQWAIRASLGGGDLGVRVLHPTEQSNLLGISILFGVQSSFPRGVSQPIMTLCLGEQDGTLAKHSATEPHRPSVRASGAAPNWHPDQPIRPLASQTRCSNGCAARDVRAIGFPAWRTPQAKKDRSPLTLPFPVPVSREDRAQPASNANSDEAIGFTEDERAALTELRGQLRQILEWPPGAGPAAPARAAAGLGSGRSPKGYEISQQNEASPRTHEHFHSRRRQP